jgi:hypothetical protein
MSGLTSIEPIPIHHWILYLKNTAGHVMNTTSNGIKENMTEADTFNVLKRAPFKQMHDLWFAGLKIQPDEFYTQHGWTKLEFNREWKKYNDRG